MKEAQSRPVRQDRPPVKEIFAPPKYKISEHQPFLTENFNSELPSIVATKKLKRTEFVDKSKLSGDAAQKPKLLKQVSDAYRNMDVDQLRE